MFTSTVLWTCGLIAAGRVLDVTLGTIRTIFVIQGRRKMACVLGFFEVTIWIFVVAQAIQGLNENILYAFSYGLGFAAGNYMGITVESWIALGNQAILVFTQNHKNLSAVLRGQHFRFTEFEGRGRDGTVGLLIVILKRQEVNRALAIIQDLDPQAYMVVEDVRFVSKLAQQFHSPTGWRGVFNKK
jgi:uncharacterized protein YebE (UPF0316 family)